MIRKIVKASRILKDFGNLAYADLKRTYIHQWFPIKPKVINMNANDICNSKCTMCNIWKQKQDHEVSPIELSELLSDNLYSDVEYVGITGGEPTLREDLPKLYNSVITKLPKLKGLSIITNAIKETEVISRIEEVSKVCNKNNVPFSMMVSLDGVGEIHDTIRGREGNFKTAINVINHFKENIPTAIGCTISKENVWYVDDLLDYLKKNKIYGRFRVAEFINRLYNNDRGDVIRSFTEDEKYHLALFFKKVELTFEKNTTYRRTYQSIINILTGGKRTIGCPYQNKGIVVDSRGDLHYCAPKSSMIGNGLIKSSSSLFRNKLKERRKVLKENCDSCIHDYHSEITLKERVSELKEKFWKKCVSLTNTKLQPLINLIAKSSKKPVESGKKLVFIVGWYGTETVGDKAILGGIIEFYKAKYKDNLQLAIAALYPFITERTIKELDIDAEVIYTYEKRFLQYSFHADEVIMGGGPLMDLPELAVPLTAFKLSKLNNKKRVVFGCGIGPLYKDGFLNATKEILSIASEIKLRDKASVKIAVGWTKRGDIELSGDQAKPYVIGRAKHIVLSKKQSEIACFLREWTHEYCAELSNEEFLEKRRNLESGIASLIKSEAARLGIEKIKLYHMHNFVVGNDDRDFSRRFIETYFSKDDNISFDRGLSTVDSVILAMKSSTLNLCMRFHSVLMAHSLETNFKAIDYTVGGKINNYLNDNNELEKLISVEDLIKIKELK